MAGVNSIQSPLQRACSVLQPHTGQCIWTDRGYGNLQAMQWAADNGFHVTSMMQADRVGLPRRYLAALKRQMVCPKKCTHEASMGHCKRWAWTVLHKGHWELEIWSDGASLVLGLSSCTSATRCVELARTVRRETRLPLCPMGIGLYNLFGRGPTDGGDSQRKRLSLACRRRQRQGPKGALFDGEIGFVNGAILASELRSGHVTVWDFADEYSTEVLTSVSMRRVTPAAAVAAAQANSSGTRAQEYAHTPIDFTSECSRQKRIGGSSVNAKRGRACCERKLGSCNNDNGEPKRPRLFCPGCKHERKDCSGWYHVSCYWKRHCATYKA